MMDECLCEGFYDVSQVLFTRSFARLDLVSFLSSCVNGEFAFVNPRFNLVSYASNYAIECFRYFVKLAQ